MSALFLELNRTVLFLSSPLAPHGEVAKDLPVVRLATKKLLVSVDAVVGLELLATTLADKHMAIVLPAHQNINVPATVYFHKSCACQISHS